MPRRPPASAVAAMPPPEPPKTGMSEANWALAIHLSPFLAIIVCCVPGSTILGPLIIWLIKRPESVTLDAVGKRVLNFQISYAIYSAAIGAASFILSTVGLNVFMFPVGLAVGIGWLVFTILGAVKQNQGEAYRPPLTLDLIK